MMLLASEAGSYRLYAAAHNGSVKLCFYVLEKLSSLLLFTNWIAFSLETFSVLSRKVDLI